MRQARASRQQPSERPTDGRSEGPDAGTTSLSQSGLRVTIVCGQTGCGKSTQVPSGALDGAAAGRELQRGRDAASAGGGHRVGRAGGC
jgi:hypothetical protein